MSSSILFRDRHQAGELLAEAIHQQIALFYQETQSQAQPIVYALPRGGLPIAEPIARRLGCPLDAIVAKKITRPKNPELAIGAVAASGEVIWYKQPMTGFLARFGKSRLTLWDLWRLKAQKQAQDRLNDLSPYLPQVSAEGAIAIVVDDGIATGMTIAVAAKAVRTQNPAQVWIGTPVAPLAMMEALRNWCDRAIVLETPDPFYSVSRFYAEFPQVEMEEALACLQHQQDWR